MDRREKRIAQLKACAEAIGEYAEQIIGDNKCTTGYEVTITIMPNEIPTIEYSRKFIPDKVIEYL